MVRIHPIWFFASGAFAVLATANCSSSKSTATTAVASSTSSAQSSSTAGGSNGEGGAGGASASTATTGIGGGFGFGGFSPTPVKELPGLSSITFYERTGGTEPTAYEFQVGGSELTTRLDDPLSNSSHDIAGATGEFYDVYYSDEQGVFQSDGSYLTISGVFGQTLPSGGGLNLAEIGLNFSDAASEFGNYVASYHVAGDNAAESTVGNCIDGDLQTHTTMGNTVGSDKRLRLTLGFESTSGPPPN